MKMLNVAMLCIAATALLAGCDEEAPAEVPRAPLAAKPKAPEAPKEETPGAPAYVYGYSPLGKRDPFRSPVEELQVARQDNGACAEPLCQWDLGQLSLVAVVTGDANPIGMVQDPGGRGFIVRRHSKIGRQGGKVTQILRDSVIVTEYWTGPDGTVQPNVITLQIKEDGAMSPAMDLATGKLFQ